MCFSLNKYYYASLNTLYQILKSLRVFPIPKSFEQINAPSRALFPITRGNQGHPNPIQPSASATPARLRRTPAVHHGSILRDRRHFSISTFTTKSNILSYRLSLPTTPPSLSPHSLSHLFLAFPHTSPPTPPTNPPRARTPTRPPHRNAPLPPHHHRDAQLRPPPLRTNNGSTTFLIPTSRPTRRIAASARRAGRHGAVLGALIRIRLSGVGSLGYRVDSRT
jgi:hypothetical protein